MCALFAGVLVSCTPEARPLPKVPAGPASPAAVSANRDVGWSYQGASGPDKWATLRPEWAACGGPGQSPIDLPLDSLDKTTVEPSLGITLELPATSLSVQNGGQLVSLVGSNLVLVMDGQRAPIESIELHTPAEHRLGGATVDVELVFVAKSASDRPLLLSLLFRTGAANAALAPLLDQLPARLPSGDYPLAKPVELAGLAPATAPVLSYEGSLSTPPCTTGALRLVVAQVGELSSDQLAILRQALPRSARPSTDRANRPVTLRALTTPALGTTPEKTAQP